MGNCSSCLGHSPIEPLDEEEDPLLFPEHGGMSYGSFGDQALNDQDVNAEAQRETESLQKVVAKTADNMVDIFEITSENGNLSAFSSQSSGTRFGSTIDDPRLARYNHLAAKLAAKDCTQVTFEVDWQLSECSLKIPPNLDGLRVSDKPLVGTFADAAAAMA